MKVTVVVPPIERVGDTSTGEPQRFAFNLIGSLVEDGHDVRLFATRDSESSGVRGEGPFEVAENGAQSNIVRQYQLAAVAYEASRDSSDVIVDFTDVGPLVCAKDSAISVLAPVVKDDAALRGEKIGAFAHAPSNVNVFEADMNSISQVNELVNGVSK